MSMLSAQCDKLRAMAESVGLAMPQAATLMMEAADTISRIDERHAKTFEVGKRWMAKAARFESENTKLRELVADMYAVIRRNNSWWDWARKDTRRFADRMRKLGMEVEP